MSERRDPRTPAGMDRRRLLSNGLVAGGMLASGALAPSAWARGVTASLRAPRPFADRRTKHLIVVAFAGGVRTKETLGTPENVPNLKAMADDGVAYMRTRSSNLGHFGAALSLFTGISEPRGIRENSRGPDPTLFEYCRKSLDLPASEVWVSTSGGPQQTNYSYSIHPDYGAEYGANTLDGDGIFNREFKQILDRFGRPREMEQREQDVLQRMRDSVGAGRDQVGELGLNDAESSARVESYILQELTRGTVDLRGPNAGDAKAMRVARNLFTIFRPSLIGVVLQNADVAHGSYNAYLDVVRQNDVALGELWTAVQEDEELAGSTSILVLPEFGRDSDLNSRRGLDHGDGSDDLNYVSCVCWGPDFRRGRVVTSEVRAIDVCPTVCELIGAEAPSARGRVLPDLFA